MSDGKLRLGMAQVSPVWLDKEATLKKIEETIKLASKEGTNLLVFGEAFLPGYPFWLAYTDGASWENPVNKDLHAHYLENAVDPQTDLQSIRSLARDHQMAIYLGTVEKAADRGGHSLYCSLVYINEKGAIKSVHRKLQPTYDERLAWASGDGNGLKAHKLVGFCVGGLNCWENWMPLSRAALYAQGVNLHVAVWPGSDYNTRDITRFIARESRSYAVSVSSVLKTGRIPQNTPHGELITEKAPEILANGGSCIAGPDGNWVVPPVVDKEEVIYTELDIGMVFRERQNFDPSGHYSRPDVTRLVVNRKRQKTADFKD